MVGEPVQQCAGQTFRAEYPGPFVERQVGGHQSGAALVTLAEHLEQQFGAGGPFDTSLPMSQGRFLTVLPMQQSRDWI